MRIDLVGPLPPPYGGISVHIERLTERLRGAGYAVGVHAPPGPSEPIWSFFRRVLRDSDADLLHFHTNGPYDKIVMGLVAMLGRHVVLTVHGQSLENQLTSGHRFLRAVVAASLRRLAGVVVVNPRIHATAIERAALAPDRVWEVPAFLPPDRSAWLAASPEPEVLRFLAAHRPVIAANAFHLRDYDGVPLYGADLLPELLARVRARYPDAGALLYVSVIDAEDAPAGDALRGRARALGLEEHFRIVTGSQPFGPALVRCDVMVRPTVTDGDAVSVREALWLGIPVVASDCTGRPAGTMVVPGRDLDALVRATLDVLAAPPAPAPEARRDPFDDLIAVYRHVLAARP